MVSCIARRIVNTHQRVLESYSSPTIIPFIRISECSIILLDDKSIRCNRSFSLYDQILQSPFQEFTKTHIYDAFQHGIHFPHTTPTAPRHVHHRRRCRHEQDIGAHAGSDASTGHRTADRHRTARGNASANGCDYASTDNAFPHRGGADESLSHRGQ